jgi:flagellar operon protein
MANPFQIQSNQPIKTGQSGSPTQRTTPTQGSSFSDALQQAQGVRFSNHAQKRLETRNISLSDEGLSRLANAVSKAEKKGGKESLVMVDDMAFIVNVKDRLVITALDSQSRGEGVFTNIDSVVFADAGDQKSTDTNPEGGKLSGNKTNI